MNGKLIHRKILEEFEPSQSQIETLTRNQIVLMKQTQRQPTDLSQAANQLTEIPSFIEEQLPPWHQLEKLLRTTQNSSIYQQVIAITDITPPTPETPQIQAQAPIIQRVSPMQRANAQSYKLEPIKPLASPQQQKTQTDKQLPYLFKIHCINPALPSEGNIYTTKWTQYKSIVTNDLLSQLTSRSNEQKDPLEQQENKLQSEMGLFMSQFAQTILDATNVVKEEIIEFDEGRHQIISHLIITECESIEFSSLAYIWRDNALSIKNTDHYSHEKLIHYTLQALSILNFLNENLKLYTNGDPLSLMTVNLKSQIVSFNYDLIKQPLQTKFGSDQYNHEYSMAHVNRFNNTNNNPNSLYPIKVIHRASEPLQVSKRSSSISKSSSIKESPVYQIVMMTRSDVVKNERTQLAMSIQNIYNEQCSLFGFKKCEMLESLISRVINGEDTPKLLSYYQDMISNRPQHTINLANQLIKENKKKAVSGIFGHCKLYQQLLGDIEIGEKLNQSLTSPQLENIQSLILIALKSAHDQVLRRKLILNSTQIFDTTILKFMGAQQSTVQNNDEPLPQDEVIDYTQPKNEQVLLCLESLLYRPKSLLQETLQTLSLFQHYCAENAQDEMFMHAIITELQLLSNGQNQFDIDRYQLKANQAIEISKRLAFKHQEIEISMLLGKALTKTRPILIDKLQQIIEDYADSISETYTMYSKEYLEIMNFKYVSAIHQAKNDDTQYREALLCQEQILKVSRQIYGDIDEISMRAFFRASMLRQKSINRDQPQSASLASYPRLKITHQAVFIVLIEVYAEFRELSKLQELLDLVYNQPIIPQIAASQVSLTKLHLALKIQELESEILLQLRLPLTESDHLECLQTLIHCCLSQQHLIQGYPSLYKTMLCYLDKYQHLVPGERNRLEKAQTALSLLIDYH